MLYRERERDRETKRERERERDILSSTEVEILEIPHHEGHFKIETKVTLQCEYCYENWVCLGNLLRGIKLLKFPPRSLGRLRPPGGARETGKRRRRRSRSGAGLLASRSRVAGGVQLPRADLQG